MNKANPAALIEAAKELEAFAKNLRQRAQDIANYNKMQENNIKRMGGMQAVGIQCARAANYKRNEIEKHAKIAGIKTGILWKSVEHYAKAEILDKKHREALARNREICRLAARGFTNSEIAKQFQISTRTVTRAIAAAYRAA